MGHGLKSPSSGDMVKMVEGEGEGEGDGDREGEYEGEEERG